MICPGDMLPLDATVTGAMPLTYNWTAASGSFDDNTIEDPTYTNTVAGTHKLFLEVSDGTTCSSLDSLEVTVKASPSLTLASATCSVDLLTYTVNVNTDAGATISVSPEGIVTGSTITGISAGVDVVVTATLDGCETVLNVLAPDCSCPIVAPPANPMNQEICLGGSPLPLTATVGSGETIDWYDAATGGMLLQGNSISIVPTETSVGVYNYYAETRNVQQ